MSRVYNMIFMLAMFKHTVKIKVKRVYKELKDYIVCNFSESLIVIQFLILVFISLLVLDSYVDI